MHCAPGFEHARGTDEEQIVSPGRKPVCGEIAEGVCALNFRQEQEITQERKITPRATEDRSHARPRNPGSADSRALSRRHRFWNLGRQITERDAALPGRQWLAKQSGSRLPGVDQDGTGSRPRAFAESGKRHDLAARATPCLAHVEPVPGDGISTSKVKAGGGPRWSVVSPQPSANPHQSSAL
jgi:hypothetical protein